MSQVPRVRQRSRSLLIVRTVAGLGLLTCLSAAMAACSLPGSTTSANAGPYYPVLQTPAASTTPTPGPFGLTVGAWPSNYTPQAGSSVQIRVSVRDAGTPVAGATVTVSAYYPGNYAHGAGPALTDEQGYATLTLPAGASTIQGGKSNRTVLVTVSVSYAGQSFEATTNFTPL